MGWIKSGPFKKLTRFFVYERLPAESDMSDLDLPVSYVSTQIFMTNQGKVGNPHIIGMTFKQENDCGI